MEWHRHNSRRKHRAPREMEPHLGDVPDMGFSPTVKPLPPMRVRKDVDWISVMWAGLITASGAILLCIALFAIFMLAMWLGSR